MAGGGDKWNRALAVAVCRRQRNHVELDAVGALDKVCPHDACRRLQQPIRGAGAVVDGAGLPAGVDKQAGSDGRPVGV